MGVIHFMWGSIYKLAINIVALQGIWISLVESMKIDLEDEYARLGHFYVEDEIDGLHGGRLDMEQGLAIGTASCLGAACCGGAMVASSLG